MNILRSPAQILRNLEVGRLSDDDFKDDLYKTAGSIAITGLGINSLAEGRTFEGATLTTLGALWAAGHGLGAVTERRKLRQEINTGERAKSSL